jgi:2-polyprenyl-6-methoxyphenol hydroxylase-like FAD-dependent oxidoreductase
MTNKSVTIIGAGPAGSAAALMLARRGWSVTLIEQHRFPRDKVCGECLSALGIDVLDRLGLMPSLREKGGVSLEQAILHSSDGAFSSTPLPRPMLGISRHVLDDLLLEAARSAGVHVRQPARCEGIEAGSVGVRVRVRELEGNVVETIASCFAILADGKAALPGPPPTNTGEIGIKMHFTGVDGPRDAIELFGCDGCYGGLASIEGGRWNAAFSVPAKRVRAHRGDIEALFAEVVRENRSLARRLARAECVLPWLASALPRFAVRKNWMPRVIPIGNAAAALEPIGGEGMGLALRSAELAAEAIDRSCDDWNVANERDLRRSFDNLWRMRRVACRAAAMVASSTDAGNIALEWMRSNESLVGLAMRSMGKFS